MSSDASRSEDIVQDRPSRGAFVQICVKSDRDRAHNGLKGRSKMKSCSSADHNRGRLPLKRRGAARCEDEYALAMLGRR